MLIPFFYNDIMELHLFLLSKGYGRLIQDYFFISLDFSIIKYSVDGLNIDNKKKLSIFK